MSEIGFEEVCCVDPDQTARSHGLQGVGLAFRGFRWQLTGRRPTAGTRLAKELYQADDNGDCHAHPHRPQAVRGSCFARRRIAFEH